MKLRFALALGGALLAGAAALAATWQPGPPAPHFIAEGYPAHLSDWGVLAASGGRLQLGQGTTPYDLATPLFSDYAGKLRTVYLPPGSSAKYDAQNTFAFPVGTIISKTFYYNTPAGAAAADNRVLVTAGHETQTGATGLDLHNVRLVETRLLVRREAGWVALPYVWNDAQDDADLMRTGTLLSLDLERGGQIEKIAYGVPNANQCASCHTPDHASRQLSPIGPKARHLNRVFAYADGAENQLAHWTKAGLLTGAPEAAAAPRNVDYRDATATLDARARAYLDINCGHCHNPSGLARTTGLWLNAGNDDLRHLGRCKPPVAAGPGTGDRFFDIVPGKPETSILTFRLEGTAPGIRMPEVGRSLSHQEGVALIRDWIASLPGECSAS